MDTYEHLEKAKSDLDEIQKHTKHLAELATRAQRVARFAIWLVYALMIVTLTLGAALWQCASADELLVPLASYHEDRGDHCELNPGIGVTYNSGLSVIAYRNSECRASVLVADSVALGAGFRASYGAAVGYTSSPIMPYASLSYAHGPVFVGLIPASLVGEHNVWFVGLRFEMTP